MERNFGKPREFDPATEQKELLVGRSRLTPKEIEQVRREAIGRRENPDEAVERLLGRHATANEKLKDKQAEATEKKGEKRAAPFIGQTRKGFEDAFDEDK